MLAHDKLTRQGGCTRTTSLPRVPRIARTPRYSIAKAAQDSKNGVSDSELKKKADDLSERILSGEFTDSGSTKEKLTRPVRKLLAQDPVGLGEQDFDRSAGSLSSVSRLDTPQQ